MAKAPKPKKPMHLEWRFLRGFQFLVEGGMGLALVWAFGTGLQSDRFTDAAKIAAPVLAIYIACASLFYNRGRALPKGTSKSRSLFAAERALQATLFSIFGVIISASYFAFLNWLAPLMEAAKLELLPAGDFAISIGWTIPLGFVIVGYICFVISIRTAAKDLMRPVSPRELAKRIRNAP